MDRVNVDCIVIDGDNRLNRLNRPLDKSHCVWRRQWGKDISSKNGWNQYNKKMVTICFVEYIGFFYS